MFSIFQPNNYFDILCVRIKLPPERVLQYIQASALVEDANFIKPASRRLSRKTWRDARYGALLNRVVEKEDDPPLLSFIGKSFNKRSMSFPYRRLMHTIRLVKSGTSILNRFQSKDRVTEGDERDESKDNFEQDLDVVGVELDTLRQPPTCAGDNWGWVSTHDELARAMKDGSVLFGFIEAPIKFPPSFKWKEGCHAGDFTDMAKLEGEQV